MPQPFSPPPVPYDATAVRPPWSQLPAALREAITDQLGTPVRQAVTAGGGFSRGFAAVLRTTRGERVFVKAASLTIQPDLAQWYVNEAAILARLPAGLPVPGLRWMLTTADHVVLCLEAIDGRLPHLPWDATELDAVLAAYAQVAAALREPPTDLVALGLPTLAELARTDLSRWGEVAAGRQACPDLPAGVIDQVPALAELESLLPVYAETSALIHCDLRLDNVLIDRTGGAWICDWNWLCHGPAWFDLAGLLVTVHASGLDADAIFAGHPASEGAPPDALDAALAALAGFWLTWGGEVPHTASPHLPGHNRWSGELALRWLANRQGWG